MEQLSLGFTEGNDNKSGDKKIDFNGNKNPLNTTNTEGSPTTQENTKKIAETIEIDKDIEQFRENIIELLKQEKFENTPDIQYQIKEMLKHYFPSIENIYLPSPQPLQLALLFVTSNNEEIYYYLLHNNLDSILNEAYSININEYISKDGNNIITTIDKIINFGKNSKNHSFRKFRSDMALLYKISHKRENEEKKIKEQDEISAHNNFREKIRELLSKYFGKINTQKVIVNNPILCRNLAILFIISSNEELNELLKKPLDRIDELNLLDSDIDNYIRENGLIAANIDTFK